MAHRSAGTNGWAAAGISMHVHVLTAVLLLGAAIISFSAGWARAESKETEPGDVGAPCTRTQANGHSDFYLPHEDLIRDQYGHWQYCGEDGEWHSIVRTVNAPDAPKPPTATGRVLTP
jgi:hypothetical protein